MNLRYLERSVLAVPATNQRMVEKALASAADVVFLDLEDSVAPSAKVAGRQAVVSALHDMDWRGRPRLYRVNALDTPFFYRDLIDVVEAAGSVLDLVMVPKVNRPEDVAVVATLLHQLEAATGLDHRIGMEVQIETAAGVLDAARIAAASPRIEAIIFGPGDFTAAAQMPATAIGTPDIWDGRYPGHRLGYAMHQILLAGRAAGLRVIDGPFADFRDPDGLRRSCEIARALGYDGKWCIHPAQIETVNDVFSPSDEEVAWARRVLDAYELATTEGRGAVALDGNMLDGASIRMAEMTLARHDRAPRRSPNSVRDPAELG